MKRFSLVLVLLLGSLVFVGTALVGEESPAEPDSRKALAILRVSEDGFVLEISGEKPRRYGTVRGLARDVPGLRGEFRVSGDSRGAPDKAESAKSAPGPKHERVGDKVRLERGDVPVLEFARFLEEYTGLPVLHDSNEKAFDKSITVAAPIAALDDEMAIKILEVNGFSVRERQLTKERRVLELEFLGAPPTLGEPVARPLIVVGDISGKKALRPGARRAQVAAGPAPRPLKYFGLHLTAVPEVLLAQLDLGKGEGLLVRALDQASVGKQPELPSLRKYDILTHVGDVALRSTADFLAALQAMPAGGPIHYRILRKGRTRILVARKG